MGTTPKVMMKAAVLLLGLVLLMGVASAADDALLVKEGAASIGDGPRGHLQGVEFRPLFPENEDLRFVAGKQGELCLGFVNTLDRFINFTHVEASLRSLHDESDVIQNMTRMHYGINTPGKGSSVAIDYRFTPDAMLDATAYVLIVEVLYRDGEQNHTEVVFNKTITVLDPSEQLINFETIFLFVFLAGLTAIAGYFFKDSVIKKVAPARKRSTQQIQEVQNSFLVGTTASSSKKNKNKKSRQSIQEQTL